MNYIFQCRTMCWVELFHFCFCKEFTNISYIHCPVKTISILYIVWTHYSMLSILLYLQMLLVVLLVCSGSVIGQRGCPMEGCDSRGLFCQADFQVSSLTPSLFHLVLFAVISSFCMSWLSPLTYSIHHPPLLSFLYTPSSSIPQIIQTHKMVYVRTEH